ncbi:FAD-dependent oxidoreductase [Roseibium aquae]|uniref:FAD-dependent oxidoreductase n=1 Tax=Roseibium aquae TaxID=1323746 RepID=A0A916WZW9_9HYPH|nr:NAD(P)-binding protein [Roseibium aquae]GGB42887.1 FAD-dependent oxidoreductase [Roseibium aquae]
MPTSETLQDPVSNRLCVIGAGLCGLTAAARAKTAGWAVTVLDKGRGVGGRMSRRRTHEGFEFDHGAQYFTARTGAFQTLLGEAERAGAVALWTREAADTGVNAREPWWVGTPGMTGLARWLENQVRAETGRTAVKLNRVEGLWHVGTREGQVHGPFERIVIAVPPAQARSLLATYLVTDPAMDRLAGVEIDPCWAVMLAFDRRQNCMPDIMRDPNSSIGWAARNASKPWRPTEIETLVVHMSGDWSKAHLEEAPDQVAAMALGELQAVTDGAVSAPVFLSAHRWRYAKTITPLGSPMLEAFGGEVLVGGDWCLGARVECAFQSGMAIGQALQNTLARAGN